MAQSNTNRREQGNVLGTRAVNPNREGKGGPKAEATKAATPRTDQASEAAARPASRRWWEENPARFQLEVAGLEAAGYRPRPVVRDNRMTIAIAVRLFGEPRELLIAYPDYFPYSRFEVFTEPLRIQKHQNPYGGNLCLLDQSTSAWNVDDTAASILAEQLPKLEQANSQQGPVLGVEVPQAEPVTFYFEQHRERFIVVPPPTRDLQGRTAGTLRVAIAHRGEEIQGVVLSIDGRQTVHPRLDEVFQTERQLQVPWRWIDSVPPSADAAELFRILLASGATTEPRLRDGDLAIEALAFPEDVTYGAPPEVGWVFLVWTASRGELQGQIARSERYETQDQTARLPALRGLDQHAVALFGVGGIGAPLAHLLMQMRVRRLHLVDGDHVSLGNAVRWPLGYAVNGWLKTEALSAFASDHYPETEVRAIPWRIGASAFGRTEPEHILLERALDRVDLVVDGTAELGVQLFLTDVARERGLPIITLEAREGGYGGAVVRYRPNRPGCYHCFKLHQRDGKFVLPRDEATGTVQPRGCGTPTFTGAPFDLVPISAYAARLASQTLIPSTALPDTRHDVALLFNWWATEGGLAGGPRWEFHELVPHAECPRCAS